MASKPIALILGAGPRVGAALAQKFSSLGYKVATASRSGTGTKTAAGFLSLKADFTKPDSIPGLFDAVRAEFHTAPSVVVYNAGALTVPPEQDNLFSIPTETVLSDLNINTISAYVAAQQAVSGWKTLPGDTKKTFIFTGNILNVTILPAPLMLNLGMGKAASAFWVGLADATFTAPGTRFYYADERFPDGKAKSGAIDGEAHAEFYAQLVNHEENVPWHATFVKDKGYVQFK